MLVDVEFLNCLYIPLLLYDLCARECQNLQRRLCQNLLEFLYLVQFNVFSSTLKVCHYLGRYSWYQSQVYLLIRLYKAKHLKLHLGLQLKFDTLMHNRMGCMGIFCILSSAVYFPLCAYSSYVCVLLICILIVFPNYQNYAAVKECTQCCSWERSSQRPWSWQR